MPTDTFVGSNPNQGAPTLEGANAGRDVWGSIFNATSQALAIGKKTYDAISSSSSTPATPPPGTGGSQASPVTSMLAGDKQKLLWLAAALLGAVIVFKVLFKK